PVRTSMAREASVAIKGMKRTMMNIYGIKTCKRDSWREAGVLRMILVLLASCVLVGWALFPRGAHAAGLAARDPELAKYEARADEIGSASCRERETTSRAHARSK